MTYREVMSMMNETDENEIMHVTSYGSEDVLILVDGQMFTEVIDLDKNVPDETIYIMYAGKLWEL